MRNDLPVTGLVSAILKYVGQRQLLKEENRWGAESGAPPGRLLGGGALLPPSSKLVSNCDSVRRFSSSQLYYVGGVTIEDWGGARGGAVCPSPLVDRYCLETRTWHPAPPLDTPRSSPGLAVVAERLWVLGGLRGRTMLSSCCWLAAGGDSWVEAAPLPRPVSYFSLARLGRQLWLVGGIGPDYQARADTLVLDTETGGWREGPPLNTPRRAAFAFVYNDAIYVCGGTDSRLKYLDTTERLAPHEG